MSRYFSIIIPVYNRPEEIDELLHSLTNQYYTNDYEVVIVEDGSERDCKAIVDKYRNELNIKYLRKHNTGAGLSRNFGMKNASGNYFIILDSDVIVPPAYLRTVTTELDKFPAGAYGGPDRAHPSFSIFQKAVNYSMTSLLTTGGLRGNKRYKDFQLRSFNMGISKEAFLKTGGFSNRKTGEDIELSLRLRQSGYHIAYLDDAFVYHKRRSSIPAFFQQTYRFGKERPSLIRNNGDKFKLTYLFPTIFITGLIIALAGLFTGFYLPAKLYSLYFILIFIDSSIRNHSLLTGILSILTTLIQFTGYGVGFCVGWCLLKREKQTG
jgi:glycosyltransferase involved in cell wall biosynthesis